MLFPKESSWSPSLLSLPHPTSPSRASPTPRLYFQGSALQTLRSSPDSATAVNGQTTPFRTEKSREMDPVKSGGHMDVGCFTRHDPCLSYMPTH